MLWERLESRRLFMRLDRSRSALVCCVPIDRSVCMVLMHLEQACCVWRSRGRASETKHETYSVTYSGSELAPGSCWWKGDSCGAVFQQQELRDTSE